MKPLNDDTETISNLQERNVWFNWVYIKQKFYI
jgi:hypothetical protein